MKRLFGCLGIFAVIGGLALLFYVQLWPRLNTETRELGNTVSQGGVVVPDQMTQNPTIESDTEIAFAAPRSNGGTPGLDGVQSSNITEQRLIELEWPSSFAVGGSGAVRLTLKALPGGQIQVTPEIPNNAVLATPILINDRYDTHTARFTARLSAPAFNNVEATTPLSQDLNRGQQATWRWSLGSPGNSGQHVITLGLEVTWIPRPNMGGSQIGPIPIWGQALQVETNYVFGNITVPQASTAGTVLAAAGFLIQIPFLGEILSFLTGGNRRKKQKQQKKQQQRRR